MIRQFAKALATIVGLRRSGQLDEAEETIAETTKALIGLNIDLMLQISTEHLLGLFRPGGSVDAGKCIVGAELLYEHGTIAADRGEVDLAERSRMRALALYLEALYDGPERVPNSEAYISKTDELLQHLKERRLPSDIGLKLLSLYEKLGRFADAEDVVFIGIEHGQRELLEPAIAFYERLLTNSDDSLAKGNLPRSEVEDSLAELRSRSSRSHSS